MGGLTDAGQKLVDGLGRINHRMLGALTLLSHGVVWAIKRMESGMGQPGLIKVQIRNVAIQHAFDGLCVVEHSVIGGLSDGHHPGLNFFTVYALEQGIGPDFGLNRGGLKLTLWDGPNDAKVVSGWLEKNRNGAGHDDCMQDRFMTIAVDDHHVPGGHGVVPNHLVAGAGAVGDEKAVIGIENSGCISLRGGHWTGVV